MVKFDNIFFTKLQPHTGIMQQSCNFEIYTVYKYYPINHQSLRELITSSLQFLKENYLITCIIVFSPSQDHRFLIILKLEIYFHQSIVTLLPNNKLYYFYFLNRFLTYKSYNLLEPCPTLLRHHRCCLKQHVCTQCHCHLYNFTSFTSLLRVMFLCRTL